jgi:hypothetical protein
MAINKPRTDDLPFGLDNMLCFSLGKMLYRYNAIILNHHVSRVEGITGSIGQPTVANQNIHISSFSPVSMHLWFSFREMLL